MTNCPGVSGWDYGMCYWQEASFRDLKSDGWQWQVSRIWTPDHANRLLLVLALAHAWVLTLGTLVLTDADLAPQVTKGRVATYSVFRLGLQLWEQYRGQVAALWRNLTHDYLCLWFCFPDPHSRFPLAGDQPMRWKAVWRPESQRIWPPVRAASSSRAMRTTCPSHSGTGFLMFSSMA